MNGRKDRFAALFKLDILKYNLLPTGGKMAAGVVGSCARTFYPGCCLVVSANSTKRSVYVRPVFCRYILEGSKAQSETVVSSDTVKYVH